jgi:signal transduction histidine kinase
MLARLSIRARLTVAYTGIVSVLLAVLGVALYAALYEQLNHAADVDLRSRVAVIQRFLQTYDVNSEPGGLPDELQEHADFSSRSELIQLRTEDGKWIYRSPGIDKLPLPSAESKKYANVRAGRHHFRVLHRELDVPPKHYILDVAVDRSEYVESLDHLGSLLLLGIPTSLLLAFFAGLWMSGRALRPIQHIANTMREIDDRRLAVRLPLTGTGDELDSLSLTLNGMLDRLERAFERVHRFTADASHELRTPLALIRGNVEIMRAETALPAAAEHRAVDVLAEADRMQALIQSLLELARYDVGTQSAMELIDPADLTLRASEVGQHLAAEKDVRFLVEEPRAIFPIKGDYNALSRVLVILLDNATRHTASGGEVRLEVISSPRECRMVVRDTGCGISSTDLPNIFDRFYRADTSRNRTTGGAGLGLSIAREIVLAHGGTIAVESEPERGAAFTISLPSQTVA